MRAEGELMHPTAKEGYSLVHRVTSIDRWCVRKVNYHGILRGCLDWITTEESWTGIDTS